MRAPHAGLRDQIVGAAIDLPAELYSAPSAAAHNPGGAYNHPGAPHRRSVLENAVHSTVSLVVGEPEPGETPSRIRQEAEHYTVEVAKFVPLFMRPTKAVFASVALLHGLGQAKSGDTLSGQTLDFSTGAVKGIALKGVFDKVGNAELNFAVKGVALGTSSRALEVGLDRHSYVNNEGEFSLSSGLARTLKASASPQMLATDVAVFGAAGLLSRGAGRIFGERLTRSQAAMSVTTAGTFGFVSGANGEIMRQREANEPMDWGNVLLRGTLEAGALSLSAVIAHNAQLKFDAQAARHKGVRELPELGLVAKDSRAEPLRAKTVERLEAEFPRRAAAERRAMREQSVRELSNAKIESADGTTRSVYEMITGDAGVKTVQRFTTAQKERILDVYGEVAEALKVRQRTTNDPEQGVTLVHTQGEMGRVLDYARRAGYDAKTTENALLSSMFSDSVKMSAAAGPANANFYSHHLDGAMAAEHVLTRYLGKDFTTRDLAHVVAGAREHQIGPPGFMATLYGVVKIPAEVSARNGKILEELAARPERTAAEQKLFEELSALKEAKKPLVTREEQGVINGLKEKIADPFNDRKTTSDSEYFITAPNGARELSLTPREADMLELSGAGRRWYVPWEGNAWHNVSRSVINGDSIDNYFTGSGISKFVAIRGPKTFFQDKVITESIQSVTGPKGSGPDSMSVMTPDAVKIALSLKPRMEAQVKAAESAVERWMVGEKIDPATAPYWKKALDYAEPAPAPGELPPGQALAIRIRERMVEELRRTGRINPDHKPSFEPVIRRGGG